MFDTLATPTSLSADLLAIGWQTGFSIRENLRPIDAGELRRTVNGTLVNLMVDEFRKYALTISSDDIRPPALAHLWRGSQLTITPASEIGDMIAAGGSSRTLARTPASGSIRCLTKRFDAVPFTISGKVVTLPSPAVGVVRIYYRPVLSMMVVGWSADTDEAEASTAWSIDLEEV